MQETYGLSRTEFDIMEFLWRSPKALTFGEILNYFNENCGKNWKKQTLNTYLSSLKKLGLIEMGEHTTGYGYYPVCSKNNFIHQWTKKFVKNFFDGSLSKFIAAFTGNEKITQDEAADLKKMLDDIDE